ncbi:MBL fold metallo-hydrolase [Sediminitomix flava]|uniref:L-ascorbate metabolism protein UlaG (Beta-lactamase superfamily) n=1 Tax=Sediminitomix flava TaxID=379075 RepID=A0A315Z8N2_SEDFL|nr:MBL fold metallo-hydrolase [Sediminitomix flava]PWJ41106.1 L-ascorbate metabolism protein UlaG (beta-lactamase superfamily) [Sediminitomix flava]
MKFQHFRNATLVIEAGDKVILVDPMLGDKGTQPTFTLFRFKAQKNPIVPLPENCFPVLERVTHCLITHQHPDHIDKAAEEWLIRKNIPVICSEKDEKHFRKKGLAVSQVIKYWETADFLGGSIMGIPATHGYGFVAKPMGNVMGYFIELPDQPSIYISADTVYTPDVDKALREFQPDITVAACGTAQLDLFKPLLMTPDEIVKFIQNSPKKVICNHMEAVNHCPTTRAKLKARLEKEGLLDKVYIPEDGDTFEVTF